MLTADGGYRAKTLVQPPREVPVRMAGHCQAPKHTKWDTLSIRPFFEVCTHCQIAEWESAWKYKLHVSLLLPLASGSVPPGGARSQMTRSWDWFYRKWRLENNPSGHILLIAVSSARVTSLNVTPWWPDNERWHALSWPMNGPVQSREYFPRRWK